MYVYMTISSISIQAWVGGSTTLYGNANYAFMNGVTPVNTSGSFWIPGLADEGTVKDAIKAAMVDNINATYSLSLTPDQIILI